MKKIAFMACVAIACCFVFITVSGAIEEAVNKETFWQKVKNFGRKIVNYPASVTQGSVNVVSTAGKRGTEVVTKETETIGGVAAGDIAKTREMVIEPFTGTADTAVKAITDTASVPVEVDKTGAMAIEPPAGATEAATRTIEETGMVPLEAAKE